VFSFLLFTYTAEADDDLRLKLDKLDLQGQCVPAAPEPRRARISYEGQLGFWFQFDVSICMLKRLRVLPPLAQRLTLLEERLESSNKVNVFQREMVSLANGARKKAEGSLYKAVQAQRRAEDKLNHWTRSPWLWFSVGIVSATIISITTAMLLKQVK
jgi:hypothetical protein